MAEQSFFPFFPERILIQGVAVLGVGSLIASAGAFFLWNNTPLPSVSLEANSTRVKVAAPLAFSLGASPGAPELPLPNLEGEMTFSFDPPRPDGALQKPPLFVRLKRTAQWRRVSLPSRIDLAYENGLSFSDVSSSFWVELKLLGQNLVEGRVFISTPSDPRIETGSFSASAQDIPVQSAHEFPEGSPFRILAEARWWGHDLFREKYGGGALTQRLEIGPLAQAQLVELEVGEWISWIEGRWRKIGSLEEGKGRPIARIASRESRSILLEGWDLDGHIRLSLLPAQPLPFKAKPEDLFTSLRIRSEKQVSCMLEKQCLILRVGDWVLKGDSRWKVLRKKEERDAFLNGKLVGELFVFDRIETKAGQKSIQGYLFNPGRSQTVPVDIVVNGQRKVQSGLEGYQLRKAKGRSK